MTFASKAQEAASERFFLVKITPRRYLYLGQLTTPNTYVYTVPENLNIESVIINGTAISSSNYTYSNDQLQITSLLNLQSTSNVVTLDHNIFLTGTKLRKTLGVPNIPDAEWEPLIANYPSFSQSMRNIADGVFSLSNTDISLICTDRWGQNLIGKPEVITGQYESLSNAPVSVWACIDSFAENRKIFDGEITRVSYRYGELTLYVIDTFQRLTNSSSFGTRAQSHVYTGNGSQAPKPEDENSAVSITMGRSSPITVNKGYKQVDPFGTPPCQLYHLVQGKKAKLIGPSNADQTTTTTWHAGRIVGNDVKKINFGTVTGNTLIFKLKKEIQQNTVVEVFGNDYPEIQTYTLINHIFFVQLSNIANFTGEIGDYIPGSYLPSGYNNLSGFIAGFGAGLYGSYNLAIVASDTSIRSGGQILYPNETAPALTLPNNTIPSMTTWIESGDTADYSFDARLLSIGVTEITEKSNFFSRYLPFTYSLGTAYTIGGQTVRDVYFTLQPNTRVNISGSTIKCRMSPNQSMTHANALKFIVKSSGMETNDATFTQADLDLAANVSVTFPPEEASEFGSYLDCAQAITNSTLGLLRVNQNRQVEYELIKNPQNLTTDGVRNSINMIQGETQSNVEYQDLVSSVEFENPQLKVLNSQSTAVVDFPIIKQVHRVDKTKNVKHVLESIQGRKDAIAGYFASPTVEYSLATASEDLASSIGDIIEINNTAVADKTQTTKGVIVSLDQSGSTTNVKINEIRGVP